MSRYLLGALLLDGAAAHTNMVGIMPVVDTANNDFTLSIVFGTYHSGAAPEGALALYSCPSTSTTAASSCTTLAYGEGGSAGSSTNALGAIADVGNVVWPANPTASDLLSVGFAAPGEVAFALGGTVVAYQQATIGSSIPCTAARFRVDYDPAPASPTVAKSALGQDYIPCATGTMVGSCGTFDMTNTFVDVDSSCNVVLAGIVAAEVAAWAKKSLALREANSRELEAAAAGSANENARAEEEARAPVVEQASQAHAPEELPALGPSPARAADAEPAPSDGAAAGGAWREEAEEEEEAPRVAKQVPRVTRGRKRYRGFRYEARQDTRQARRRQPKVVVVGAGFAGVAAAARLQKEYGYQVELLEARGRIGGRVHSLLDGEGTTVELGAAVLMGTRGHPLATLCRKHSVKMERLEPSCPLHDSETGRQLPPELDARVESLFNDALDSASAAARAPHASALFAYAGAELEVESRGEWRRALVVARRTGTPRRGPSHGAASSSSSPPGATPPTAAPPPVVDEAAEEAEAEAEVEVSARVTRASPVPPLVPPPVLTAAAAAAAAGEPPRRRADSEYSSETPPTLPSPGEPAADLASEALVRYLPPAEKRAAPGKGRAEEEVEEWIALPSARLRPPALETALAGALRARRAASAADDLGGEEMAGAAERALQWHLANLEFACAASLGNDDAFDYEGDHVLLPEGGYQGLLHRLADGVEARCGITVTGIEMRDNPCRSVALWFDAPFWGRHSDFFGRTVADPQDRGLFFLFLNLHRVSGQPVLLGLVAGGAAERLEELDDEQAVQAAVGALRGMFGASVPEPRKHVVTRWGADPHSRGSYSYVAAGARGSDYAVAAEPVGGQLFFAGEHTSVEHPATVVGAYLSGLAAATAVHKMLRKKAAGPAAPQQQEVERRAASPPPSKRAAAPRREPASAGKRRRRR
ncbi:hypothetical protein EMIHUDRAFT_464657 [Emiliania huxleyi CCMP1516]|uniref:Amine oxidase domain-containing protein n=2 Tax=Emiliania huxleyi TaxID=2903 RepID=A0A0D3IRL4_EMIH1|nr:hypothetical protein EMIHUDRAFT_464657 [Emiliania huxleyi CCMP1516]EOD13899.1 hypothetical protein EMIHUDRAFT_464657 [Emiliania huxleyi CCMP1516]|eukprot:XP_005766328.1 hypothetical protein EMIHUDRAFT_464657 [Emiliania huxleyi CCMP1516]